MAVSKSQDVRRIDFLLLGPFMMWAATQRMLPEWARVMLFVSGVLTVTYNAENYHKAMMQAQARAMYGES